MMLSLGADIVWAKTTINNSVNVSANSSGGTSVSQASVTTIVDGEIVESWSVTSTDPISYEHTVISASSTNAHAALYADTKSDQTILRQLIKQLQALIALYVTLLQQQ